MPDPLDNYDWMLHLSVATHPIHVTQDGDWCSMCGDPAAHKVGEENLDSLFQFHNLTNYLCCLHFKTVIGDCDSYPYAMGQRVLDVTAWHVWGRPSQPLGAAPTEGGEQRG